MSVGAILMLAIDLVHQDARMACSWGNIHDLSLHVGRSQCPKARCSSCRDLHQLEARFQPSGSLKKCLKPISCPRPLRDKCITDECSDKNGGILLGRTGVVRGGKRWLTEEHRRNWGIIPPASPTKRKLER